MQPSLVILHDEITDEGHQKLRDTPDVGEELVEAVEAFVVEGLRLGHPDIDVDDLLWLLFPLSQSFYFGLIQFVEFLEVEVWKAGDDGVVHLDILPLEEKVSFEDLRGVSRGAKIQVGVDVMLDALLRAHVDDGIEHDCADLKFHWESAVSEQLGALFVRVAIGLATVLDAQLSVLKPVRSVNALNLERVIERQAEIAAQLGLENGPVTT